MKTLYLHVGPHKTGTTYIQNCLANNIEALADKGIAYPATGITPSVPYLSGHHELIHWLAGKQHKKNAFQAEQLFDDIGIAESAIISSENTCSLSEEELTRIRDFFHGWDIHPVMFLRRRSAIMRSQWQENVKWGSYYDLSDFLVGEFIRPFKSHLVNQKLLLDKMAAVFGKGSLIIMNYDLSLSKHNDIADELLLRLFGKDTVIVGSGETLNSSLSYSMIDLIRVFNAAYIAIGGVPRDVVRGIVLKRLKEPERNHVHEVNEIIQEVSASRMEHMDIGNVDNLFPNIERSILSEFRKQLPKDQPTDALFPEEDMEPVPIVRIADLLFTLTDTIRLKEIAREYFPEI